MGPHSRAMDLQVDSVMYTEVDSQEKNSGHYREGRLGISLFNSQRSDSREARRNGAPHNSPYAPPVLHWRSGLLQR